MQFFGEKYGDIVRVVQIGGRAGGLDGYSMELCGGTHTRATGEIGLFRILSESAIAAGIRRIEAVAGLRAYEKAREETALISTLAGKVNSPVGRTGEEARFAPLRSKRRWKSNSKPPGKNKPPKPRAPFSSPPRPARPRSGEPRAIIENLGDADGDFLQAVADALKSQFKGVVVLGGSSNGRRLPRRRRFAGFHRQIPGRQNHAGHRADGRRQRRRAARQRPRRRQGRRQTPRRLEQSQGIDRGQIARQIPPRNWPSCTRRALPFLPKPAFYILQFALSGVTLLPMPAHDASEFVDSDFQSAQQSAFAAPLPASPAGRPRPPTARPRAKKSRRWSARNKSSWPN